MVNAALCWTVTCFCVAPMRAAEQPRREDTQVWSEVDGVHQVGKNTDLLISGGFRLGRDASHPVYERGSAGLAFKAGRYLTIAPTYSYYATQPVAGADARENRISLDTTAALPLGHWIVSDRNRFERRFIEPRDSTRYRNRIEIEHPIRVGTVTVGAFLSDEAYYDWSYRAWVRNRVVVGGGHQLNKRLYMDAYFVRQDDGRSRPRGLNAVGVTFRVRF